MIYENIEFHNNVELEPASGGGLAIRRYPKAVRDSLCQLGRLVSQESAGCELRFVTESPNHGLDKIFFVGGHGHYNFGDHRNSLSEKDADSYLRINALKDSGINEEVWCTNINESKHYNTEIANETIKFIKDRDKSKAFFSWCSFPDPHHPFSPPEPWYSMYLAEKLCVKAISRTINKNEPLFFKKFYESHGLKDGTLKEMIAKNYGMISMVDHNIGRVITELKNENIYDDTIILFFSDHGDYMGDHGLMRKAALPYEGVYRIPTLWCGPGISQQVTDALHSTVDLLPTILDLLEIEVPNDIQGVSQKDVLNQQKKSIRENCYAEYDESIYNERVRFLRTDKYYFSYMFTCKYGFLFDMDKDPDQKQNLFYDPKYNSLVNELFVELAKQSIKTEPWLPKKLCHA
ncbi:sulfatase-like hydrolase/transferase [Lentisphaera marina]|uniref:sulfatase family protein n=1 Tax=Lentisphaera marina TaxID=1111041 RepID=UPI0023665B30|nr:sulfatase-like hydrolase/transferase [Lentisphaera marina]MDD7984405.1 sulfatase-like hydrolase/transferase [Lentisphaera marina]